MQQSTILVVGEAGAGGLDPVALELIAIAKGLSAATGQPLAAGLAGPPGVARVAEAFFTRGVREIYVAEHAALADGTPEGHARALESICRAAHPDVVLIGRTTYGQDVAPCLAQRLGTGVVMNCIQVRIGSSGELEAVCPVFGGAAHSVYQFGSARPRVIAFQPHVAQAEPASAPSEGKVIEVESGLGGFAPRARVVRRALSTGARIEDARVIVAGGLGLEDKQYFRHIQDLAAVLGGLPAASRAIVDKGWATSAQQVGLTGKVVSPDLYIAMGISGASQHMAGCSSARTIVAVNTDRDAPIFKYAKFGVAADLKSFLPAFIQECRKLAARDSTG